jgi:GH35 family endo-1,4-beta-xylanase
VHQFRCVNLVGRNRVERLVGAHLLGTDNVPARGSVALSEDLIACDGRTDEPLALSLLWPVHEYGEIQIDTARVPSRPEPYVLQVELARRRLMQITFKREEWGLFDYEGMEDIAREIEDARDAFLASLDHLRSEAVAAKWADIALTKAVRASERMAQFHAGVFINRRIQARLLQQPFLGAGLPCHTGEIEMLEHMAEAFDFARLPFNWRNVQPTEHDADFSTCDAWVKACRKAGLAIHGGPLLSFGLSSIPDWLFIWENDHEALLDFARDHVQRTVKRYAKDVKSWVVCAGLHANDAIQLNFEEMIELTRVAATTAKKIAPHSQIVIDLTQPWGEYFARNPRTVPPALYAEMVAQSGIPFDAFGLQFLYGIESEGYHLRDLFQISSIIDRLANLGKPIHITAVTVPSADHEAGCGGSWNGEWTESQQANWLQQFCEIALSRPFVESVCLNSFHDRSEAAFPTGGIISIDGELKEAYHELTEYRDELRSGPI